MTHRAHQVHSKVQIIASADSGGRSTSQHSQLGRNSNMPQVSQRIAWRGTSDWSPAAASSHHSGQRISLSRSAQRAGATQTANRGAGPCFRASPCTASPIDKAPPASRHERTSMAVRLPMSEDLAHVANELVSTDSLDVAVHTHGCTWMRPSSQRMMSPTRHAPKESVGRQAVQWGGVEAW